MISEATDEKNVQNDKIQNCKNGIHISNDKDKADYCNYYFVNIGYEMFKKYKTPINVSRLTIHSPKSMLLKLTNPNEVIKYINSLNNNCAS